MKRYFYIASKDNNINAGLTLMRFFLRRIPRGSTVEKPISTWKSSLTSKSFEGESGFFRFLLGREYIDSSRILWKVHRIHWGYMYVSLCPSGFPQAEQSFVRFVYALRRVLFIIEEERRKYYLRVDIV